MGRFFIDRKEGRVSGYRYRWMSGCSSGCFSGRSKVIIRERV